MSDNVCRHCKHYEAQNAEIGQCRRYPPETYEDGDGMTIEFPLVKYDLWCGEFARLVN